MIRAPASVLKKCAGVNNADGLDAVGEFASPVIMNAREFVDGAKQRDVVRVLAVEGVQDPGNLGTLTRTAVAFGWDTVALLPGTCDPFNDKAMRAARGATFRVDFVAFDSFDDLASAGRELNMELYAAEPSAKRRRRPRTGKGCGEGVSGARHRRSGIERRCLARVQAGGDSDVGGDGKLKRRHRGWRSDVFDAGYRPMNRRN